MGPNSVRLVFLQDEEIRTQAGTEGRSCEDTERRCPSLGQEEGTTLPPPGSGPSSLQTCEELNFCSLSLSVSGTLLL